MAKVLLVEDERDLADNIKRWLEGEHYSVEIAYDGDTALHLLQAYQYDVIILDWALPEREGIDVLRAYRHRKVTTPTIMLTGYGRVEQKEIGLDAGADDYLTKPFEPRELSARIRTLLRRVDDRTLNVIEIGNLMIDLKSKRAVLKGSEIFLTRTEFALLEFLVRHPNQTFTSLEVLNAVWKSDSEASVNTVKSFMYTLRKKLSTAGFPDLIETLRGVGYKAVINQEND